MSTHHSDSSNRSTRSSLGRTEKTGREVICKICQAVYVPSETHRRLAHASQAVVESAFMSMCHFCFRCRQPACPSCWDDVHDVCGACALEAQLPFRSSVPPLDGVVFPPIHDLPLARVRIVAPPLVCVRPGRFQRAPLPVESRTTLYLETVSNQPIDDPGQKPLSQNMPLPSLPPPPSVIENVQSKTLGASALPPASKSTASKSPLDIEERTTQPEKRDFHGQRKDSLTKGQSPKVPMDIANVTTRPERKRVHSGDANQKAATRRDKLTRAVTDILFFVVLLVVLLIVTALIFPSVNDGMAYLLHVDIRADIAYLLQLIQHLF
jgi:hypothetical protein